MEIDVTTTRTRNKTEPARLAELWASTGEPLLERFLDDPEKSIKIFFSSHFREKGLLWYIPL
jgi:hypothetical protein